MRAGKEVRQQTARVIECRSILVLTKNNEPAQKRRSLDTASYGATKHVTSYGTLTAPTSGTACKTPDDDGVWLGFLIPVDSDKPDEIVEEPPPIDRVKLLQPRHNDPGWQALPKNINVYQ